MSIIFFIIISLLLVYDAESQNYRRREQASPSSSRTSGTETKIISNMDSPSSSSLFDSDGQGHTDRSQRYNDHEHKRYQGEGHKGHQNSNNESDDGEKFSSQPEHNGCPPGMRYSEAMKSCVKSWNYP